MVSLTLRPPTAVLLLVSIPLFLAGIFAGRSLSAGSIPDPVPPVKEARVVVPPAPVEPDLLPVSDDRLLRIEPGMPLTGDRIIRGSVRTADGRPLSGVTVRAIPDAPWDLWDRDGPPPEGDPLKAEVEAEVRHLLLERNSTRETVSDQSGAFLFTGISDVKHSIRGYKPGFEVRKEKRDRVRAGEEIRLIAHPVVELEVRVLGPDGKPPERATVKIFGTGRFVEMNRDWRPGRPRIDLDPGPIRIRASGGTRSALVSEEVERMLEVGVRPEPVVLKLREQTGIRGTLSFPPAGDDYSSRHRILALRVREGAVIDPSRLLREHHHEGRLHRYSPRGGTGDFIMIDLPPGTYLVGVAAGYDAVPDSKIVRLTSGMETVDLAIPLPGAGETTMVRVLGPDGRPVRENSSGNLQARHVADDGTITTGSRPSHLGNGVWRVPNPSVPIGKEAGGRFLLLVSSTAYGSMTVEYEPRASGEVEVRWQAPATLDVTLPDYPGSSYEGVARIRLEPAIQRERRWRPALEKRPDPHGRASFGPLAPGEWIVSLGVSSGRYVTANVLRIPVHLVSGTEELVLAPPALVDLTVQTSGQEGTFRLQPLDGGNWRSAEGGPDGVVRFTRLTAGSYILWRYGHGTSEAMRLELGGTVTVRFDAEVFDALRVSILDPEGILGTAGLEDGDLVVAIAGTQIESADHGRALLALASAGGPVNLTVLRGSEQLTIPVDLSLVYDPKRAGGALRPWPK